VDKARVLVEIRVAWETNEGQETRAEWVEQEILVLQGKV
jgi:hypothetical protein